MSPTILLLRPEPGASQSAERARALGLEPVVAPIFVVHPIAWQAPAPEGFDGIVMTSANAARHGGPDLARYRHLPCHVVGEATAEAARTAGFGTVHAGPSDIHALLAQITDPPGGERRAALRLLHPCGRDHVAAERAGLSIRRVPVYAADAVEKLPDEARSALVAGALVLLHSPRAGAQFSKLVDEAGISRNRIRIAAISGAAAKAAGGGWAQTAIAEAPRDEALLALAARIASVED